MSDTKLKPPFRIAIVPGSFKGSFSALAAARYIEKGLRRSLSDLSVHCIPMADGGDGTVEAIADATGGKLLKRSVSDPLGRRVVAALGLSGDGTTAVIEMARASGLALLSPDERNPLITSTRGTGELMLRALRCGATRILVGIGGSATNDAGTGMARALGVRFLDKRGRALAEGGGSLVNLASIDVSGLLPGMAAADIEVACDVTNPLVGPRGAAAVYGPQKGATPAMVKRLDRGLRCFASVVKRDLGVDIARVPGAGAAGGLGAGLLAILGARLRPGVDIVMDAIGLEGRLAGHDLVITGEGRLDGQTVFGKTPTGVARLAKRLGIPVIAICGALGPDAHKIREAGVDVYFAALEESVAEGELATRGPNMLMNCAEQVGRLMAMRLPGRSRLCSRL